MVTGLGLVLLGPALARLSSHFLGIEEVDYYGTLWFYWFYWFYWFAAEHWADGLGWTDLFFFPWGKDILLHTGANVLDALLAAPLRWGFGPILGFNLFSDEDCDDTDDTDGTEPQFVDALSGTTSPAGTFTDPWLTVQDGIDTSSTCVVVAPATYYENIDFGNAGITVLGAVGAESTIIDGGASGPVVTFDSGEAADSILTGFTLTNGSGYESVTTTSYSCGSGSTCVDTYTSWCGGGIYIDGSSPTLTDLVVQDNDLTTPVDYVVGDDNYHHFAYGGGVCVLGTTVEMEQVNLRYNYAVDGGGAYVDSTGDLSFEQGYVVGNTAESGGGFEVDGGDLTLINVASWQQSAISGQPSALPRSVPGLLRLPCLDAGGTLHMPRETTDPRDSSPASG